MTSTLLDSCPFSPFSFFFFLLLLEGVKAQKGVRLSSLLFFSPPAQVPLDPRAYFSRLVYDIKFHV